MTPKEKAIELVTQYDEVANQSKECALICVDAIISACEYNHVESYNTAWWNEVKQEINNL